MNNEKHDYRVVPFWSWNGDLNKERLDAQMQDMAARGFGGFFMHARGGLKTEYLSEKWFDMVRFCIEKGKEYGLQPWVYDENGWPSGFADGKLLKEEYYIASLKYEKESDFCVDALGNYRQENGEWVKKVENDGGKYAVIKAKYNFTYVDLMNPRVAPAFVKEVHEKYKERFGNEFVGFFTDEPQYSREGIPWSIYLKAEYEKRSGGKVEDDLIYLFEKCGDKSKKVRYDYYTLANELFLGFIRFVYEWCKANGYKLTGHTIDENWIYGQIACCGNVSPFYEYEDIPAIDWLSKACGRNSAPKQCSSVAEQLGKRQVLFETFGASGWNASPKTLKRILDFQLANGVNTFCYHVYPYSVAGERKHDFPPFFSEHAGWMKYSRKLNDYCARVGKLLGDGEKRPKVLLMHALSSAYLEFERYDAQSVRFAEDAFCTVTDYLTDRLIPYHIGDEVIISEYGKVENGKFIVGKACYDCVVLPDVTNLRSSTYELLKQFINSGGKLVKTGDSLRYKDGAPFDYDLPATAKAESLDEYSAVKVSISKDLPDDEACEEKKSLNILSYGGTPVLTRISCGNGFQSYLSEYDGKKVLFVMNYSAKPIRASFESKTEPIVYDAFNDEYFKAEKRGAGYDLSLAPDESRIYIFGGDEKGKEKPRFTRETRIDEKFELVGCENSMPLDMVSYSVNGGGFTEFKNVLRAGKELLDMRYAGKVRLKYRFENRGYNGRADFFTEPYKNATVYLNGKKCEKGDKRFIDRDLLCYKLDGLLNGENEIIEEFDYFQREEVYYVLYTEGVSETLKNKLVYDTELDSAYLTGEFEVGADELKDEGYAYLAKGLYLRERKNEIDVSDLIKSGYPFLCEDLIVKKSVKGASGTMDMLSGVQTVCVNYCGKDKGVLFGFNSLDLGEENDGELTLTLTANNRNLLGPSHNADIDPDAVCPWDFYKLDGDETAYSLIKTGIKDIKVRK